MIFFDVDETVLETKVCYNRIYQNVHDKFNFKMPVEEFERKLATSLRIMMIRHMEFNYNESLGIDPSDYLMEIKNLEEPGMKNLREDFWNSNQDIFKNIDKDEFFQFFKSQIVEYNTPIEGMVELIADLSKEYELGIITNGVSYVQHKKVENLNISRYFKKIYVSGDYGYGKPDPKYYRYIINDSGADVNSSIMIGDNIQGDIFGALAIGMKAIYFNGKRQNYNVVTAEDVADLRVKIKETLHEQG